MQAPHSDTGKTETSLYIDNRGYQPKSTYITDKGTDTGKTYVVTTADDSTDPIRFDHVHINSAAHLVFQNTSDNVPTVTIGYLHGDKTGMLHVTKEQPITVEDNETPFPASFRIYENAEFNMPQGTVLCNNCLQTT